MNCPQCGAEMEVDTMGHPNLIINGLPDNIKKRMQVIEYYDTGYNMHPDVLHYWTCFACRDNIETPYFSFVIFKDKSVYCFVAEKQVWEKFVLPEVKVKID